MGEYQNVQLEQLIEWINKSLPPDAVLAGPMPTMANLLLSTGRPIVNHPHYEDAGLRERTKQVVPYCLVFEVSNLNSGLHSVLVKTP